MPVERSTGGTSIIDVLDRVLDKGIVIDAWVRVSLVGIDLITVEARVVVASIDTYLKYSEAVGQVFPVAQAVVAYRSARGRSGGERGAARPARGRRDPARAPATSAPEGRQQDSRVVTARFPPLARPGQGLRRASRARRGSDFVEFLLWLRGPTGVHPAGAGVARRVAPASSRRSALRSIPTAERLVVPAGSRRPRRAGRAVLRRSRGGSHPWWWRSVPPIPSPSPSRMRRSCCPSSCRSRATAVAFQGLVRESRAGGAAAGEPPRARRRHACSSGWPSCSGIGSSSCAGTGSSRASAPLLWHRQRGTRSGDAHRQRSAGSSSPTAARRASP